MRIGKWLAILGLTAVIAGAPWLYVLSCRPSINTLETSRHVVAGSLITRSGSEVEVHLAVGDILRPRDIRRDIGFDLAVLSLYFDPVFIDRQAVLPLNPVLGNAVRASIRSPKELEYLLDNVSAALSASRDSVTCFLHMRDEDTCDGDKLVPFVWPVYQESSLAGEQHLKYFGALPLFDPSSVTEDLPASTVRLALGRNLRAGVRRLLSEISLSTKVRVHSVAFPFLGATSHTGGDSPYFLAFPDSLAAILRGVAESHSAPGIDRVYLVAFGAHKGVFRREALEALQSVADAMAVSRLAHPAVSALAGITISLLYLVIALLSYQSLHTAIGKGSRWEWAEKVSGVVVALLPGATWGILAALAVAAPSEHPLAICAVYSSSCLLCTYLLLWLSKRT